jgi:cytochrome c-type biogenesis protein
MADVGPLAAFAAGLLAFFSPCVLPILPGYLGFVAGGPSAHWTQRFGRTFGFTLGFLVAFAIIGFLIGAVGQSASFLHAEEWLRRLGGALIIVFGLAMTGLLRFAWMDRDVRVHDVDTKRLGPIFGPLALGAAFGVGWSPCVGPILASILVLAGLDGGAMRGGVLLAFFGLGLGAPMLAVGMAADRAVPLLRRFNRATRVVEVVAGVFLILLGIAVFTGAANRILLGEL